MKKRYLFAAAILIALLLAMLAGCGNDGSLDAYLSEHSLELNSSPSDVTTTTSADVSHSDAVSMTDAPPATETTASSTVADQGALPEEFIGSWSVVGIFQEAGASDISTDEALRREKLSGLSFSYNSFIRYDEAVTGAIFKVNKKAAYSDLNALGIQTEPLSGMFGADAQITSIEIRTPDDMPCTTVFLIDGSMMLAFGQGMNVFSYELVEAVG